MKLGAILLLIAALTLDSNASAQSSPSRSTINPGFDENSAPWVLKAGEASYSAEDAQRQANSGSAAFDSVPPTSATSTPIYQDVPVSPGTLYVMEAQAKVDLGAVQICARCLSGLNSCMPDVYAEDAENWIVQRRLISFACNTVRISAKIFGPPEMPRSVGNVDNLALERFDFYYISRSGFE